MSVCVNECACVNTVMLWCIPHLDLTMSKVCVCVCVCICVCVHACMRVCVSVCFNNTFHNLFHTFSCIQPACMLIFHKSVPQFQIQSLRLVGVWRCFDRCTALTILCPVGPSHSHQQKSALSRSSSSCCMEVRALS